MLSDHYLNANADYARQSFNERLAYLDKRIGELEIERDARRAIVLAKIAADEIADPDVRMFAEMMDRPLGELRAKLDRLQSRKRVELMDRGPLDTTFYFQGKLTEKDPQQLYSMHLDSPRWERIRIRKFASIEPRWHCEYPGCSAPATECHHKHYRTLGFEENCDLEALCRRHHQQRHNENRDLSIGNEDVLWNDWDQRMIERNRKNALST